MPCNTLSITTVSLPSLIPLIDLVGKIEEDRVRKVLSVTSNELL